MQVNLLPSSPDPSQSSVRQFLSSYLINETVAVDAGCLGLNGNPQMQSRVKHVFLTHSHIDHLATLPIFLDNAYTADGDCVTVYATESILQTLRSDLFNDRLWPDFIRISENIPPYLRLQTLEPRREYVIGKLNITPVPVNHVIETMGYLVDDGSDAVVFSGDTGNTDELWTVAERTANLRAIFVETTFPNELEWMAEIAQHLTPARLAKVADRIAPSVRIVVVHIHPRHYNVVTRELKELPYANIEIGQFGVPYCF